MAFGNWRDYLRLAHPPTTANPLRRLGGREEVSLKKYLYVFRRLLARRWIERRLGRPGFRATILASCRKALSK